MRGRGGGELNSLAVEIVLNQGLHACGFFRLCLAQLSPSLHNNITADNSVEDLTTDTDPPLAVIFMPAMISSVLTAPEHLIEQNNIFKYR